MLRFDHGIFERCGSKVDCRQRDQRKRRHPAVVRPRQPHEAPHLVDLGGQGPATHTADDGAEHQTGKPLGVVRKGRVEYAGQKHQGLDGSEAGGDRQPPESHHAAVRLG